MDLITTPSAPDANSYLSVDDANTILTESQLYSTTWDAATDDDKVRVLLWATRLIDTYFDFDGSITVYPTQALAWPRYGVVDREGRVIDQTSIPLRVEQATAEFARFLLARDRTQEPSIWATGLSQIQVGPIDLRVDQRRTETVNFIPDSVVALLSDFGSIAGSLQSGAVKIVPLLRG